MSLFSLEDGFNTIRTNVRFLYEQEREHGDIAIALGLPNAYSKKTDIKNASKDHYMVAVLIPLETKRPVILVPRAKLSIGTDSKHDHTSKSSTDKSAIPAPPPNANHSSIVSQPDAGDVKFLSDRKSM